MIDPEKTMTPNCSDRTARDALIDAFQHHAGWGAAERSLLAGDASFRKYWRLQASTGATAVIMDAPPTHEDVRPFIHIARHLSEQGFSAPRIDHIDQDNGFLLLEDLGDGTYTRLLAGGEDEWMLYSLATDVLAELSTLAPPANVPPYDEAKLLTEAGLLPDWFLPSVNASISPQARAEWDQAWQSMLPIARSVPSALVLRDYHVDNLLLLPERLGLAACGLLDFQDAVVGPLTYDIMSLLEDARRDIDPGLVAAMKARFLIARPDLHEETFAASWAVMAAQRHAKVIGIFARLFKRDGKPNYLVHIPRVWRLLDHACQHPACAPICAWLDTHVPADVRQRVPQ